jgi:hypothetical protein
MSTKRWMAIAAVVSVLCANGSAFAAPQCFSVFGGTVTAEFNTPLTGNGLVNGRMFGALASCAGLTAWPLVGSSYKSATHATVVAFRVFTVDASFGAVDWIASLTSLSGPAQLHNDRNNFSNSTTMTVTACPVPLPGIRSDISEQPSAPVGVDEVGNSPE